MMTKEEYIEFQKQIDSVYEKNRWLKVDGEVPDTVEITYGEITRQGVSNLILEFPKIFSDPNTVFYDIGCGYGNMVMHVAISCPIKKAVGIEYIPERCQRANDRAKKFKYLAEVEFQQGDVVDADFSDATVIYVDNTMPKMMDVVNNYIIPCLPDGCLILARNFVTKYEHLREGQLVAPTTYNSNAKLRWGYKR